MKAVVLEEATCYNNNNMIGPPGNRNLKRTHSLFIYDLKVYQQNREKLKMVNETIVKACQDTGACYEAKKCAGIVFNRGQMEKARGLYVLAERMKVLDPEQNENYKFLGCEQAEQIDTDAEMDKSLTSTKLYKRNLIKAINTRVVPVASYVMDV